SNRMLPVSRSLRRTCQACSPSGNVTRQPSLRSKRRPLGPCWVGISAGAGYGRLAAAAPESFDAGTCFALSAGAATADEAPGAARGAGATQPGAFEDDSAPAFTNGLSAAKSADPD